LNLKYIRSYIYFLDIDVTRATSKTSCEEDLATAIGFDEVGRIIYSGKPGLGIEFKGFFRK
jgi:hypothetical protein